MRDLTKSLASYTWAMSVFGIQQMANLFIPRDGAADRLVGSLDRVSAVAQDQLSPAMRSAFRAGDELQRLMIDLMFGGLVSGNGGTGRPRDQPPPPRPAAARPPAWSWGPPRDGAADDVPRQPQRHTTPVTSRPVPQNGNDQEIGWGPMP
jgi:hypothetical protein